MRISFKISKLPLLNKFRDGEVIDFNINDFFFLEIFAYLMRIPMLIYKMETNEKIINNNKKYKNPSVLELLQKIIKF